MSDLNSYMRKLSLNIKKYKCLFIQIQDQKDLKNITQRYEDSINFDITDDSQIINDTKIAPTEGEQAQYGIENEQNFTINFQNHIDQQDKDISLRDIKDLSIPQNSIFKQDVRDSLTCNSKYLKSCADQRSEYQDKERQSLQMDSQDLKYSKSEYYFSLYINIRSFYRKISKNVRIQENLTKLQHALISDKASVFNHKETLSQDAKNKFCGLISINIQHLLDKINLKLNKIPIFIPYNFFKKLWDSLVAFLILMVTFLLSLAFFFNLEASDYKTLFRTCFIIFIIDICVTFNTGIFKNNGDVLLKRNEIAKHYLHKEFLADQLGLSPLLLFCFDSYETSQISSIFYLFILLKWVQLKNIFQRLNFYFSYQRNKKNLIDLISLIFFIVCVCHAFSLFWHGLAMYQIKNGRTDTWLHKMDLLNANAYERYLYSFYFLSTTMISVGYGDISPQNPLEIIFTILTMFTTGVVYAFSLNTIGRIIDNMENRERIYKQNMQTIHLLMREEKVDQSLRIKISNYIEYQYKVKYFYQQNTENPQFQNLWSRNFSLILFFMERIFIFFQNNLIIFIYDNLLYIIMYILYNNFINHFFFQLQLVIQLPVQKSTEINNRQTFYSIKK